MALPNFGRMSGPMRASPYRIQPQRAPAAAPAANTGNILAGGGAAPAPFPASTPVAPPPRAPAQGYSPYRVFGGGSSGGSVPGATGYARGQAVSNPLLRYGVRGNVGGMSGGPRRPGTFNQNPSLYDASYSPAAAATAARGSGGGGGGMSIADQLAADHAATQRANEGRYQDLLSLNQTGRNEMLADLGASTGALTAQNNANTQSLMGYTQAGAQNLQAQAGQGYGNVMDFLTAGTAAQQGVAGKYSDAEQKLEAQRYGARQGEIKQEMLDRGLRNTTVDQPLLEEAALQNSIRSGIINDRLRDRELGILGSYTNTGVNVLGEGTRAELGAADAGYRLGYDAMSGGQRTGLGISANYANARQGVLDNSRRERMGVIEGRTDEYPDLSLFYSLMGQPRGSVSGGVNYGTRSTGGMGITPAGRGQQVGWNPLEGLPQINRGGPVPATVPQRPPPGVYLDPYQTPGGANPQLVRFDPRTGRYA